MQRRSTASDQFAPSSRRSFRPGIEVDPGLAVAAGRDHGPGAARGEPSPEIVAVIALVGETSLGLTNNRQIPPGRHSTVTLFARLRGWSTSVPLATAT